MDTARQIRDQVKDVRRRTRASLASAWFPPVVFGLFLLVDLAFVRVGGPDGLNWREVIWLALGPLGVIAVYVHAKARDAHRGVVGSHGPEVLSSIAMAVGLLFVTGTGFFPFVSWLLDAHERIVPSIGHVLVPPVAAPAAIAAGYLVLGACFRSSRVAAAGLAMGLATALVGTLFATAGLRTSPLGGLDSLLVYTVVPTLAYAACFIAVGLLLRRLEQRPL